MFVSQPELILFQIDLNTDVVLFQVVLAVGPIGVEKSTVKKNRQTYKEGP